MTRTVYDIREAVNAENIFGGQICRFEGRLSNRYFCLHRGV